MLSGCQVSSGPCSCSDKKTARKGVTRSFMPCTYPLAGCLRCSNNKDSINTISITIDTTTAKPADPRHCYHQHQGMIISCSTMISAQLNTCRSPAIHEVSYFMLCSICMHVQSAPGSLCHLSKHNVQTCCLHADGLDTAHLFAGSERPSKTLIHASCKACTCADQAHHLMPQMYSMRSRLFWMMGSWNNSTLGAVRGTSTLTCQAQQHRTSALPPQHTAQCHSIPCQPSAC